MKASRSRIANAIARAEKRSQGKPALSKYELKRAAQRQAEPKDQDQ